MYLKRRSMTALQVDNVAPPLPIQLRMCITESGRITTMVERVLNSHIRECPQRQGSGQSCSLSLCQYFNWHWNHYAACTLRQVGQSCESCMRFRSWVDSHLPHCTHQLSCGISLCSELKKQSVKDHFKQLHNVAYLQEMVQGHPVAPVTQGEVTPDDSSITLTSLPQPSSSSSPYPPHPSSSSSSPYHPSPSPYHPSPSSSPYPPYSNYYCYSSVGSGHSNSVTPSSSASSSPASTVFIKSLPDPEASLIGLHRTAMPAEVGEAVHSSDPHFFIRTESSSNKSLMLMNLGGLGKTESSDSDASQTERVEGEGEGEEEGEGGGLSRQRAQSSINSLDRSLSLTQPQHTSSYTRNLNQNPTDPSSSTTSSTSSSSSCLRPSRLSTLPDSAIGTSGSENELNSPDSDFPPHAPLEIETPAETPSTLQPGTDTFSGFSSGMMTPNFTGDSLLTGPRPSPGEESFTLPTGQQVSPEEAYPRNDMLLMENRGRPMLVRDAPVPSTVGSSGLAHVDHDWIEMYKHPRQPYPQSLYDQFYAPPSPSPAPSSSSPSSSSSPHSYPEDEETIRRVLDHRESVREYLQGQFYMRQTYREHEHWSRVRQIGHGGQAKCFCIEDNSNHYLLCLKEERESHKTLDETFICLKLAMLVRDAPQNIVEFFGASILPHFNGSSNLQLFLELMPGCLQGYVYEYGPLPPETTLNYSYQLFEALDYLHQTLKIIHCDIKPANLLIDDSCQRLKVADFGCAELLEECCYGSSFPGNKDAGTLWYNPPEFYCRRDCGFGMDMWQAGCSVLFMCTGRRPWRHLCMDVDRSSTRTHPNQAAQTKKKYREMIGEQRSGPPLPGFLVRGLYQLLAGCLRLAGRLSARDCAYITARSEACGHEQERRIVEKLGYTPSPDVLLRLQSCPPPGDRVDIYLGEPQYYCDVDSIPHAILNGWLGSVPYQSGMTYGELENIVRHHLPVTQHFGDCNLATCDNDPRVVWRSVNGDRKRLHRVRPDQPVDLTKAFLLLPTQHA